jgi:lysophospholipase L1-like esterase
VGDGVRKVIRLPHIATAWLIVVAVGLLAGLTAVPAAAVPAAAVPAAAASSNPCAFGGGNPVACSSSDPRVTKLFGGAGDCSTTEYALEINWGDKSAVEKVTTSGTAANQYKPIASHAYKNRGTYSVQVTGTVTSGPCTYTSTSYSFTLAKISGKLKLAALGDSYSSGEGTQKYYAGTGGAVGCHRSPLAWAVKVSHYITHGGVGLPSAKYLLACSGAESDALVAPFKAEDPQVLALRDLTPKPAIVTLTMGGNDLGFSDIIADCYIHNCVKDGELAAVEAMLPAEEKTLAEDYKIVQEADPKATLLIIGYPEIFEQTSYCGLISPAEEKALNELTAKFDGTIAKAASGGGFAYVNDLEAFKDHWMCTSHPWLYEIGFKKGLLKDQQQAHPNAAGQVAIAKVVAAFINSHL